MSFKSYVKKVWQDILHDECGQWWQAGSGHATEQAFDAVSDALRRFGGRVVNAFQNPVTTTGRHHAYAQHGTGGAPTTTGTQQTVAQQTRPDNYLSASATSTPQGTRGFLPDNYLGASASSDLTRQAQARAAQQPPPPPGGGGFFPQFSPIDWGHGMGGFEIPGIDLPDVPDYDPAEEAARLAEQQRQERIAAVNRMIDQKIRELEREEGRVPGFYRDLREQLALTREGGLEGSTAALQGIERTFGESAHQLHDIRDQWKNEAITTLMARGTLTSGQADRAMREIDNIMAKNVTSVMRDKDLKVTDVMEGKRNVQEAFSTAIGQAEKEKQEYLKELSTLQRQAEEMRGQETANIEDMIAQQTPILERELGQNLWAQQMQHAAAEHGMGLDIAQQQMAQQAFQHQVAMDQQRMAMQMAQMQASMSPAPGTPATMTPYQQASLGMRDWDQQFRAMQWQEDQRWKQLQQQQGDMSALMGMITPAMQDPMGAGIPMIGMMQAQPDAFGAMYPGVADPTGTAMGLLGPAMAQDIYGQYQQATDTWGNRWLPWSSAPGLGDWTTQQYGAGVAGAVQPYMGMYGNW